MLKIGTLLGISKWNSIEDLEYFNTRVLVKQFLFYNLQVTVATYN